LEQGDPAAQASPGELPVRGPAPALRLESAISKLRQKSLLQAGLLENVCSQCGLVTWSGAFISMHIDHIMGVRDDHRLENLRMLCPNYHSQTPTYGGKNNKRQRGLQEPLTVV
jgi:hypothetical protein